MRKPLRAREERREERYRDQCAHAGAPLTLLQRTSENLVGFVRVSSDKGLNANLWDLVAEPGDQQETYMSIIVFKAIEIIRRELPGCSISVAAPLISLDPLKANGFLLDPNGINDMIRLIKNLKMQGKTICLSTHNLKDVEELCTDFTVFKDGFCSNSVSLNSQLNKSKKWIITVKNPELVIDKINQSDEFSYISSFNNNIIIETNSKNTIKSLNVVLENEEIYKISKDSNLIEYF